MASPIEQLQSGGFTEDEIATWAQQRRDVLSAGGFKDNEIDAWFTGGVTAPERVPASFAERIKVGEAINRVVGKTAESAAEGWGDGTPTGMSNETLDDLIRLGVFHDPQKGGPGPIQFANEAVILPIAKTINVLLRGLNAGVYGAGGLVGGIMEELGSPQGEANRAKNETINFANWLMLEAGFGSFTRTRVTPQGVVDDVIGGPAKSEDFVNAARAVGDDAKPVQEKLLRAYEEQGRHPAEVATDAQADAVVAQRLLSKDPKDAPYSGGEKPPPPPESPPKPPEPPEPGSFGEAQQKILDKISVGEKGAERPWTLSRLYTEAIDDLHPLKAVSGDAYQMARLTRGQFGKAEHFLEYGTFDFNTYKTTGAPLKTILDPVRNDLDGLRAYLASKRSLDLEASGRKSGMDLDAARRVVAEGEGQYGKISGELVDYQNRLLTYLKDAGVVSDKAFDAMVEANQNYVPFFRVFAEQGAPGTKGFGPGNPLKKLKGSERDIYDPLESIIKNTYAYVSIAERNQVGITLIDALKKEGFKVESKRAAPLDRDLADHLKAEGISDPAKLSEFIAREAADGTTLSAWRNGVREEVKVNDPELVAAFRGIDRQSAGLITRVAAVPAKTLRAGAVLSPDFIARNIIRDFMTAFVNTSRGVFTPIDTARGLMSAIRKDADFQNWLKSGGANSTMVALDRAYLQESLQKLTADTGLMERSWNVITHPIREGLKPLQMVSELAEAATRLGEFKRTARGETSKAALQEAAFASREVTLDFARMGARMRAYNMVTAFANAQLQGMDRVVRAFKDRPVNTMAKVAGGITLPSVLLWWANHDDQRYKDLPHWQKDLFWIVLTDKWQPIDAADAASKPAHLVREKNGKWEFNNGSIWRIPKPFELGVIFGSGAERALEATVGQSKEAFDGFTKSVIEILTPNFMPTAVQPLIEQWSNRSTFSDRTLIPADVEKHLPEYQYTPYTTQLSRQLGQVIAAFPGMREASVEPGHPSGPLARALTTPILIENYVRGWTGGLGMYAMQAADAALRKAGKLPDPVTPTPTLADIPFVKAFAVRYPSAGAQPIQDFYDGHEKAKRFFDTWMARAREGDSAAMARIEAAGGPQTFGRLDAIKDTLSEHSKLIRDIYKNPEVPADEKRQLIDGLYYAMIQLARSGREMQRQIAEPEATP